MASRSKPNISHGGASVSGAALVVLPKSSGDTSMESRTATAESTATPRCTKPGTASSEREPKLDVLVHQKLDNWLLMIRQERKYMMKGPRITIYISNVTVTKIPKRAAMAISKTLNDHFTANPHGDRFYFESGSLTAKSVRTLLLYWLRDTSNIFEAHEVLLHDHFRRDLAKTSEDIKKEDFELDVAVLRTSRLLGMEQYTKSMMQYYNTYITTGVPDLKEIACVEAMRTSSMDPLWTTTVNRLTYLRYNNLLADPKRFSKHLKKHPVLAKHMESADQYFRSRAAKTRRDSGVQAHQDGDYKDTLGETTMIWIESPLHNSLMVLYQALFAQGQQPLPNIYS